MGKHCCRRQFRIDRATSSPLSRTLLWLQRTLTRRRPRQITMFVEKLEAAAQKLADDFPSSHPECETAVRNALEHLIWAMQTSRINSTDRTQIAAIAFASRVMQLCYAAFTSIRSGNTPSAQIVMRAALEALFALGGLSEAKNFEGGNDFYMRLLYKSKFSRMKAFKRFLKNNTRLTPGDRASADASISAYEEELKKMDQHALTQVRDVADAASMLDTYEREYALHSNPSHSDIEDVVNTHVTVLNGKVGFNGFAIDHDRSYEMCAHLVFVLMEAASALQHMFNLEQTDDQRRVCASLSQFYGKALTR